jgi:uncharacterized membrane protein YeaQ/YmgE (transglycosylase-associated protein family)
VAGLLAMTVWAALADPGTVLTVLSVIALIGAVVATLALRSAWRVWRRPISALTVGDAVVGAMVIRRWPRSRDRRTITVSPNHRSWTTGSTEPAWSAWSPGLHTRPRPRRG